MLFLLRRGGEGAKCKGGRKLKRKKKKRNGQTFMVKPTAATLTITSSVGMARPPLLACGLLTRRRRERVAGVTGSNIYIYPVGRGIDKHVTHLQFYGARGCSLVSEEEAVQWSFVGAGGRL